MEVTLNAVSPLSSKPIERGGRQLPRIEIVATHVYYDLYEQEMLQLPKTPTENHFSTSAPTKLDPFREKTIFNFSSAKL